MPDFKLPPTEKTTEDDLAFRDAVVMALADKFDLSVAEDFLTTHRFSRILNVARRYGRMEMMASLEATGMKPQPQQAGGTVLCQFLVNPKHTFSIVMPPGLSDYDAPLLVEVKAPPQNVGVYPESLEAGPDAETFKVKLPGAGALLKMKINKGSFHAASLKPGDPITIDGKPGTVVSVVNADGHDELEIWSPEDALAKKIEADTKALMTAGVSPWGPPPEIETLHTQMELTDEQLVASHDASWLVGGKLKDAAAKFGIWLWETGWLEVTKTKDFVTQTTKWKLSMKAVKPKKTGA